MLYDPDGKITVVTGKEAKYFMNQRDLEVFGDVHTTFPDGFELISDYLRYLPNERHVSWIPREVHGRMGMDTKKTDRTSKFDSHGMDFAMGRSEIILPEDVHMTMEKQASAQKRHRSHRKRREPDRTTIDSDRAVIHRDKQVAAFYDVPRAR